MRSAPTLLSEYLTLLDWSGRQVRAGKRGVIPDHLAPILERLGIYGSGWLNLVTEFDRLFTNVVGRTESIAKRLVANGRQWYQGQVACRQAFG